MKTTGTMLIVEADPTLLRGLEAGADDYLANPSGLSALRARIQALLRRQRRAHSDTISFGDCVWEPSAKRLTRAGKEVALSPQERQLLEFLIADKPLRYRRTEDGRFMLWSIALDGKDDQGKIISPDVTQLSHLVRSNHKGDWPWRYAPEGAVK